MGGGGWKRVTLDSNKERGVQMKSFWFVKMEFFADSEERHVQKPFLCVKNGFE